MLYNNNTKRNRNNSRVRPKGVIDANLIGHPFILQGIGTAREAFVIAKEFSKEGVDVTILCDNETRDIIRKERLSREGECNKEEGYSWWKIVSNLRIYCVHNKVNVVKI